MKLSVAYNDMLLRRKFAKLSGAAKKGIKTAMDDFAELVIRTSITKYLAGPYPRRLMSRSGRLGMSLKKKVKADGFTVYTNLIYARIHEKGGVIVPRRRPYLVFRAYSGRWVRTKRVRMPARPYLAPALKDSMDRGKRIIRQAIEAEIQKAVR